MRRTTSWAIAAVILAGAAGCGSQQSNDTGASGTSGTSATSAPTSSTPAVKQLDQAKLDAAMIGLNDLPPGWSIEAATSATTTSSSTSSKAGCDTKDLGLTSTAKAERSLTKGGGLSTMVGNLMAAQFASEDDAKQAMTYVRDKFAGCVNQSEMTLTPVAPSKVGDEAASWRLGAKGATGTVNVARSGPLLVLVLGGGIVDVPTADLDAMMKAQIDKYQAAVKA